MTQLAESRPISWFEHSVIHTVPLGYPGAMRRVYPGFLQLTGFMQMNLDRHVDAHFSLFRHLIKGDGEGATATKRFYDEYMAVLDLASEFYLETVEWVFQRHLLPRGEMLIHGDLVDPGTITRTALLTVEGELDDISAPGQTLAAHDLCRGLKPDQKHNHLQKGVGHYGIFNGKRWRETVMPVVRDWIRQHGSGHSDIPSVDLAQPEAARAVKTTPGKAAAMAREATLIEVLEAPFPLPVAIEFRRSHRARRISLRVDVARGRAVLVAPQSVARRHALDFLRRQESWLRARIAHLPQPRPFVDGAIIPILGMPHRIVGDPTVLRGTVTRSEGEVRVPGAPEHLGRRLTDYLKAEAKREIATRAKVKAGRLNRPVAGLTLRDTRSRWGSCNSSGRLAFSWRLIFAPEPVLDYVVAHEVAHLIEMNHGARFWRLCAELTQTDPKIARAWLRQNGPNLHSLGPQGAQT